jgi:cytochrome c556
MMIFPAGVRAEDQDAIDYRRHIMATLSEEAAALGQILQKKAPAEDFATHAQILAITAATAKKAFEPKAPGGDAKPAVWTNWSDFAKRLDDLTAATADLAKTAKEGGTAAAAPKVEAALTCNSCHDTYREKAKTAAAVPAAKPEDAVDYREYIMKSLNEQSAALGMILSAAVPADSEGAHMEAIALSAKIALKAFEPKVQGGQSKPEIWTNWADFSKRMNDFAQKTGEMARLAKEKGPEEAAANVIDALSCKSCHDLYRDQNKK